MGLGQVGGVVAAVDVVAGLETRWSMGGMGGVWKEDETWTYSAPAVRKVVHAGGGGMRRVSKGLSRVVVVVGWYFRSGGGGGGGGRCR